MKDHGLRLIDHLNVRNLREKRKTHAKDGN